LDNDKQEFDSLKETETVKNNSTEDNTQEEKPQGHKRKLTILLSLVLVALVAWQGISSIMFNEETQTLQSESNNLQGQLDKMNGMHSFTLVQLVDQIKDIQKNNDNLLGDYRELIHQYRFTLSFLRSSLLPETLESRNEKLCSLTKDGNQLLSLVQRSEQIDKDVAAVMSSNSMTWDTAFGKMDNILIKSSDLKSDAVRLVMPEQLKFYHETFTEALSEKDLYLAGLNDYLHSDFNAYNNANIAVSTYNNAYFYWEVDQAVSYANEAEKYRSQAEYQLAEAASHWERYMKLKEKIKGVDGESI